MGRNLTATVTLAVALLGLWGLVLFQTFQVHHYEELVLDSKAEIDALSQDVNRLAALIERGAFVSTGTQQTSHNPVDDADLPPAVLAQRRYYSDEEWAGLLAPGNMLSPRTQPYHVEGTQEGGTFVRAMITDFPSLHTIIDNAANITEVYRYVTQQLAARKRDNPDEYYPELAYRIEVNEDHTQYHVYLRHGIKWHRAAVDFSNPRYEWLDRDHFLTADDFAFFFEIITNPAVEAAHLRNYYEDYDHIEILNDNEFIVHWKRPFQGSIDMTLTIEPQPRWLYAYDEDGTPYSEEEFAAAYNQHWYADRAVGVGPYRFVRREPNVAVELERNEDFHDERPPIQRMIFRIIGDPNTRVNNLLAGEIEYTEFLPLQYDQYVLHEGHPAFHDGTIEHQTYQGTMYRYLGWNADRPLFADRRVRRAMTHALNREQIIRDIFHGLGRVQTGNFFIDGPYNNPNIEPWPFDLERAADLLTQAGWVDSDNNGVRDKVVDGVPMELDFVMTCYGYRQEFMAAMEIYRSDLESIGVRMHLDGVEWPVMVERMQEKDFDAYTGGWVLSWDSDPYQIWHSSQADVPNGSNRVGFRNAEADQIIETARETFDTEERIRLFHRFHEIVHEEQPYTFFFAGRDLSAWRSELNNVNFSPIRPFDLSHSWYMALD